jgi:CO/xanthine dehydrogenase Mo-binding subunit
MWSSTQVPHIFKTMTALTLGLPEHKVRDITISARRDGTVTGLKIALMADMGA